jgi:hypothetical protein
MTVMEKKSERLELKKQKKELLELILKKTNLTYNELLETTRDMYITANLEVLTPEEKKQFTRLSFAK